MAATTSSEPARERLLRGAAEAFGRLGYSGTRVEDVLRAAGLSRPTFYKFFKSKEDVFDALLDHHHATIRERILHAQDDSADPLERVEAVIETFLKWRAELGPIGRVLDAAARAPGSRPERHRKRLLGDLAQLWNQGLEHVGLPPEDPLVFTGLIAAAEALADTVLTSPHRREQNLKRAKAVMLRMISGTLTGSPRGTPP